MLWPIVLPAKITFWGLAVVVVATTALTPESRNRMRAFLISLALASIAFVPSCMVAMLVVDAYRFGHFEYKRFEEVRDFRARRFLPPAAANIKMRKSANGYEARYVIAVSDFHTYLDSLWQAEAGARTEFDEGQSVDSEYLQSLFGENDWGPLDEAVIYYSPRQPDGGGATYYLISGDEVVLQQTGYW